MPGSLLSDQENLRTVLLEVGGNGKQQRARAGDDYFAGAHIQSRLGQSLKAARAHDVGQGPAGKWEKALTGSGGKNQFLEANFANSAVGFRDEGTRAGLGEDAGAGEMLHAEFPKAPVPVGGFFGAGEDVFTAPD